jgi:hypothetical protein
MFEESIREEWIDINFPKKRTRKGKQHKRLVLDIINILYRPLIVGE